MFSAAAFALFCLACSVLAFKRHPIYGVYFYIATTYVFPPGRWWGYLFPDVRWAFVAAAVTTLAIVLNRGKLRPKPPCFAQPAALILLLYSGWMWVQTAWALDVPEHVRGSIEFLKCLFALWFVYRVADSKEGLKNLIVSHVLGCALLGIYALSAGRTNGRLDGVGGPNLDDSNTLGMYLATGALCAIGLVLSHGGWRRYVSLASLVLIINGFVLANSRGSFLGLAAGTLTLAFCISRRHRRMFWAFCMVGAIGLYVLVDKTFIDRMYTIEDVTSQDESADPSARSRLVIAEAQLQMFLDHPIGVGWRGTAVLAPQYLDNKWLAHDDNDEASRSSHNTFLTALVEQGIVGALIYSALVLWIVGALFRCRRLGRDGDDPELATLVAALTSAIVAVLVAGMTADYLVKEVQFWLFGLLLSGFWLSTGEGSSLSPAAASRSLPLLHMPAQRLP